MTVEDLIVKHEGLRLAKYQDTAGHWTIGVGHNLDANPLAPDLYEPDGTISEATAMEVLDDDLLAAEAPLQRFLPWFVQLDQVRQAVLTDLSFNIGWSGLSKFSTFLHLMAEGYYALAAQDLLSNTLWAKQVPERAREDCTMLSSGQWPAP